MPTINKIKGKCTKKYIYPRPTATEAQFSVLLIGISLFKSSFKEPLMSFSAIKLFRSVVKLVLLLWLRELQVSWGTASN